MTIMPAPVTTWTVTPQFKDKSNVPVELSLVVADDQTAHPAFVSLIAGRATDGVLVNSRDLRAVATACAAAADQLDLVRLLETA